MNPSIGEYLLSRTVDPAGSGISLSEAKSHLRVQHTADDAFIASLIAAVDSYFDAPNGAIGKALYTQTWQLSVAFIDGGSKLHLPVTPVQSIFSITYFDSDNVPQSLAVDDFYLYKNEDWAYLCPKPGASWPSTYCRLDAVTVTFVAGYGASADIPQGIKQAMLLTLTHWYENRSASVVGHVTHDLPLAVDSLISLYRKGWVS